MGIKTNINTAPYYDDFDVDKEFYKVLFRPGFSIQARELTTLQTMMQNQIENFGSHVFTENTMVIDGEVSTSFDNYNAVKLQSVFGSGTYDVSTYYSEYIGTIITGAISGVTAEVLNATAAAGSDPITLFVKYTGAGTNGIYNGTQKVFLDDEELSCSTTINSSIFAIGASSSQVQTLDGTFKGSSVSVAEGVYFVRGHFVKCNKETIILDKYSNTPSYKIGFDITESIITPEGDISLLDNSKGSSNFSAKGSHRLSLNLKLVYKSLEDIEDVDFVHLLDVKKGVITFKMDKTEYATISREWALRTKEESGDYSINRYDIEKREHLNDGDNNGIYLASDGGDNTKAVLRVGEGTSYVHGYRYSNHSPVNVEIDKSRTYLTEDGKFFASAMGNYINVNNIHGVPEINYISGSSEAFKLVSFYDTATSIGGVLSGNKIGSARVRGMQYNSGTISSASATYKLYIFDASYISAITLSSNYGTISLSAQSKITGVLSGATAYINASSNTTTVYIRDIIGEFLVGESLTSSYSGDDFAGGRGGQSISSIDIKGKNHIRQVYMPVTTGTDNFTCDPLLVTTVSVTAGGFIIGETYTILTLGSNPSTDFTLVGAANNTVGTSFIATGVGIGNGTASLNEIVINEQEETVSLFKLPRSKIKTLLTLQNSGISETTISTKQQFFSGVSAGQVTFTAPSGQAFEGYTSSDYIMTITAVSSSASLIGAVVDLGGHTITNNVSSIEFSGLPTSISGVKLIASLRNSSGQRKVKIPHKAIEFIQGGTFTAVDIRHQLVINTLFNLLVGNITSGTLYDYFIDTTGTNGYKPTHTAGFFVIGHIYTIVTLGTTTTAQWQSIGVSGTAAVGTVFTATGVGTGTGTATTVYSRADFDEDGSFSIGDCIDYLRHVVDISIIPDFYNRIASGILTATTGDLKDLQVSIDSVYGRRPFDKDISLDRADVYKIRTIYDSEDLTADAVTPTLKFDSTTSNAFVAGETITGGTSGAKGSVISSGYNTSTRVLKYVSISGLFLSGEVVSFSAGTGILSSSAADVTDGSKDISSSYLFDDGQRDTFYDISSIKRKPNSLAPIGKLLIIYDYFSHDSTGDFFSVDSYNGIDYKDIPSYIPTKTDPDAQSPAGQYDLSDCLDFRSKVADNTTSNIFFPENRSFDGTTASSFHIPRADSLLQSDFDYYLSRKDSLFLTNKGIFFIKTGIPAEFPVQPEDIDDAMKLAEIDVPAYTDFAASITINILDNSRYTMRDIGRLEKRISSLEYYTSLNMLEQQTNALQIHDGLGFDRMKMGYIVDTFAGHSIGDVLHPDYNCSIDPKLGMLRPRTYIDNINLETRSLSTGVLNDGIISLPYESIDFISQISASRAENVNPFAIQTFIGILDISPKTDTWISTKTAPEVVINVEGNYDSILKQEANNMGTIYDSWSTHWTGEDKVVTETIKSRERSAVRGLQLIERSTLSTDSVEKRNATETRVVESIDKKFIGNQIIDTSIIPWMRDNTINFKVYGLKPNTQVYPFFDSMNVSSMCKEDGASLGTSLIADTNGYISGIFELKNTNSLRFKSGKKIFRLTDSSVDSKISGVVDTSAEASFVSSGALNTEQGTFLAIRNAEVHRSTTTEERTVTSTRVSDKVVGWWDPLAQSFLVESDGGCFVTELDLYFESKDSGGLPVTVMIRSMENGYPAKIILPGSTVVKNPSDVTVSADGSVATKFIFSSPVYLKDKEEYCIIVQSSSINYKCWISQVGDKDILSTKNISKQPYMGVLFKSQNTSTWTASQLQDLKFKIYKAKFDITNPINIILQNKELTTASGHIDTLAIHPLETQLGTNVLGTGKIKVNHPNHGMHSTTSNVTISGVVSPPSEVNTSTLGGVLLTKINKTHNSISDIEPDSYCISVNVIPTQQLSAGGSAVTATRNIPYNVIHPIISTMMLTGTNVTNSLSYKTGTTVGGSEISYFSGRSSIDLVIAKNNTLPVPGVIASKINEDNEMSGEKSVMITSTLSSTNENLSPILDTDRMSLITISNKTSNINSLSDIGALSTYVPSTEPIGDNNISIYMTKKVSLSKNAKSIKVLLTAAVQSGSEIEIYYKIANPSLTTQFDDEAWVRLKHILVSGLPWTSTTIEDQVIPVKSKDESDFKEYEYMVDGLGDFQTFAIKIVMKTDSSSKVPLLRNMRAIAMAS